MSTYVVLAFFLTSTGCLDAKQRFDDFGERVVDAAPVIDGEDGEGGDITGRFLLAIDPKPLSPGNFIRYIATVQMTVGDNPTVNLLQIEPLDFETGEFVDPPVDPQQWTEVAVDAMTGRFSVPLDDSVIPGRANPIIPDLQVNVMNGELIAVILAEDSWCGDVTGTVAQTGSDLTGSTFGTIPIGPDVIGAGLPAPIGECGGQSATVDAGVPDAMPADAMPADAMPADAMPADAMPPDAAM